MPVHGHLHPNRLSSPPAEWPPATLSNLGPPDSNTQLNLGKSSILHTGWLISLQIPRSSTPSRAALTVLGCSAVRPQRSKDFFGEIACLRAHVQNNLFTHCGK
jgi:hypothetical protein